MNIIRRLLLVGTLSSVLALDTWSQTAALPQNYKDYSLLLQLGRRGGSGFFLQTSNSVYIVTARHVLYDTRNPTNFTLWNTNAICHSFARLAGTNTHPQVCVINLLELEARKEIRYATNRDVALVRISRDPDKNNVISLNDCVTEVTPNHKITMQSSSALRKMASIDVGADIYLFGFPVSIGVEEHPQIDPYLPLMRKGIVAGLNPSRKTIILDCPVYQGNSGGPVWTKQQWNVAEDHFHIIGIVVEWIPFRETWANEQFGYVNQNQSNSGYSVVEPVDTILALIWR